MTYFIKNNRFVQKLSGAALLAKIGSFYDEGMHSVRKQTTMKPADTIRLATTSDADYMRSETIDACYHEWVEQRLQDGMVND